MPTASNPAPFSSQRIPELDGLRGLAILLVILCHYVGNPDHAPLGFLAHRFLLAFTVGWSGVDLFFVLSGFLIGGILLTVRDTPHYFRTFYLRRAFRILPIYYLWTLLFALSVLFLLRFFPAFSSLTIRDLSRVPVQLFFFQNIFIGMPHYTWTWFVVTWTLAIEEQFYLLAPPLIRFLSVRRFVILLFAAIVLAPVLRFMLFRYWASGTYLAAFLMPCRADSLSCGMLLAVAWRNPAFQNFVRQRGKLLYALLAFLFFGVVGLLWWLVHPLNAVTVTIGYSWLAFFYSALLLTVIAQPAGRLAALLRWPFLAWLGGISYCVYLLHDSFNFFAHWLLLHAEPQLYTFPQLAVSALAILATFAIASLSWRYFEKPLIRRGHTYNYGEIAATKSL